MPFCDQCGSAITVGARFCDECGAPAVAEQSQTAEQSIPVSKPTERAPLDTQAMWYAAAGAVLAAFIGIMASYLIVETATDAILGTMPTGGFSEQLKSNTFKFGALNYYGAHFISFKGLLDAGYNNDASGMAKIIIKGLPCFTIIPIITLIIGGMAASRISNGGVYNKRNHLAGILSGSAAYALFLVFMKFFISFKVQGETQIPLMGQLYGDFVLAPRFWSTLILGFAWACVFMPVGGALAAWCMPTSKKGGDSCDPLLHLESRYPMVSILKGSLKHFGLVIVLVNVVIGLGLYSFLSSQGASREDYAQLTPLLFYVFLISPVIAVYAVSLGVNSVLTMSLTGLANGGWGQPQNNAFTYTVLGGLDGGRLDGLLSLLFKGEANNHPAMYFLLVLPVLFYAGIGYAAAKAAKKGGNGSYTIQAASGAALFTLFLGLLAHFASMSYTVTLSGQAFGYQGETGPIAYYFGLPFFSVLFKGLFAGIPLSLLGTWLGTNIPGGGTTEIPAQ
jgi:hypothetical protein